MTEPRPDARRQPERPTGDVGARGPARQPQPSWDQLFAPDGDLSVRRARATAAQPRRRPKPALIAGVVAIAAVATAVGVIAFVSTRSPDPALPSSTPSAAPTPSIDADASQRLRSLLPVGYSASACHAVPAPADATAKITCLSNGDAGGPTEASYVSVKTVPGLQAAFDSAAQTVRPVVCPGNVQSPGPWRRNATPDRPSGTLLCGTGEGGSPVVIWSDNDKMTVSRAVGGTRGPALPYLYQWWSVHS